LINHIDGFARSQALDDMDYREQTRDMTTDPAAIILGAAGTYALAAALLTMLPGPDTAVVLATAVNAGRPAARRAAGGVAVGLLFWAGAASLGVAAVLRASAELFLVFRIACIAYLLWLAFHAIRAAARRDPRVAVIETPGGGLLRLPWGFRRALATAVLNPKLGVFFVVIVPQFVPSGASAFLMTLLFGVVQAAEALVWYLALGSVAVAARTVLNRPRVRRTIDGLTAAVFVFFGARLALDA
jgi:threonine/homoserine/homoserine lactone efflux protein